jgi:hypothetical protein
VNTELRAPLTTREVPYQVVMIAAILELIVLAVLSPRGIPADPQVLLGVSGIRFLALIGLAGLVHDEPPRAAWPALSVWALILWPPELWAHALEATAMDAWRTGLGTVLIAFAAHTAARRVGAFWWLVVMLFVGSVFVPIFSPLHQLVSSSVPWWILLALVIALFGWFSESKRHVSRASSGSQDQ